MPYKIINLLLLSCLFTACSSLAEVDIHKAQNNRVAETTECGQQGVWLQVLGSGGPEITDQRASSSYLIWIDNKARVLIDAGGGSALNFEKSGASFSDIDMILLSHLHVDHSADLDVYIKGSFFADRRKDLLISGPGANEFMPAADSFVKRLFNDEQGAYQYLGDHLPNKTRRPAAYEINAEVYSTPISSSDKLIKAQAVTVKHGSLPALAWRLDIANTSLVFSGDMASGEHDFIKLLKRADIFVAHNAIPEKTRGVARFLHMPPSVIGKYAQQAKVSNVILSHRMQRTLGVEPETLGFIKNNYRGNVEFADDLDCFQINP